MSILNAYHLPRGGETALYPEITPINSFRVILDYYFAADLGLKPDVSLFVVGKSRLRFFDVSSTIGVD